MFCLWLSWLIIRPEGTYVTYSLVSNPFVCLAFVSNCPLLLLAGCSGRPLDPTHYVTLSWSLKKTCYQPTLPKSYANALQLMRVLPHLSCGQPQFPAYPPSWSGPALVVCGTVYQGLQVPFSFSPQAVILSQVRFDTLGSIHIPE